MCLTNNYWKASKFMTSRNSKFSWEVFTYPGITEWYRMVSIPAGGVSLRAVRTSEEKRQSLEAGWSKNQGCLHSQKRIKWLSETWTDFHRLRNRESWDVPDSGLWGTLNVRHETRFWCGHHRELVDIFLIRESFSCPFLSFPLPQYPCRKMESFFWH